MTPSQVDRNVSLYKIYMLFNEPLFWGPILVYAMQKLAGMTLPEILFMESMVVILYLLFDLPSGMLADKFGRKKMVILGRALLVLDMYLFASMQNQTDAWIANFIWALGASMQSGADTSLIYDTLKSSERESEFKKIQGGSLGNRFLLAAFCGIAVGYMVQVDLRFPLYTSVVFVLIPLVCACMFCEPEYKEKEMKVKVKIWKIKYFGAVIWMVVFVGIINMISKAWFFTYNPYLELVGFKLDEFGQMFFWLNIVAWLSSKYSERMEKMVGEKFSILLIIFSISFPLLIMGMFTVWQVGYMVLFQNLVRGFITPFASDYVNSRIDSSVRATVLSLKSTVGNFLAIVGLFGIGEITKIFSLPHTLIIMGLLTLVLGLCMYLVYHIKIR